MHALRDVSAAARPMTVDWASTYESHAAELTGYLTKLAGDREVASELMQETFVKGMRAGGTIRDPGAIRAWLYRTATNLEHNHRRRRAILRFVPFSGEERSAQGTFDADADQVRQALGSLSADGAATLLLFYVHGFSREELAAMFEVSEETVKSRLARGRRDFMAAYQRLERGLSR
jgi:RNA polymerase sigma-70 factor (ECF subfamily)